MFTGVAAEEEEERRGGCDSVCESDDGSDCESDGNDCNSDDDECVTASLVRPRATVLLLAVPPLSPPYQG